MWKQQLAMYPPCRFSIAEAALDGLKPDKFAAAAAASSSGAPGAGDPSAAAAGPQYPGFASVQQYLLGKHPQLGRPVEEGAQLPLPAKVREERAGGGGHLLFKSIH